MISYSVESPLVLYMQVSSKYLTMNHRKHKEEKKRNSLMRRKRNKKLSLYQRCRKTQMKVRHLMMTKKVGKKMKKIRRKVRVRMKAMQRVRNRMIFNMPMRVWTTG